MESTTLDLHGGEINNTSILPHLAGKGMRFLTYLIDVFVCYALVFVLILAIGAETLIENDSMTSLYFILLFLLYYAIMEGLTGKTIGKFLTGTKVINQDGENPTFINALGRTLCRLIPFEAFSLLFGNFAWHDRISKTYVVKNSFSKEAII